MIKSKKYGIIDSIKIPFKYTPVYSTIIGLEQILSGFLPAVKTVAIAMFIDGAISIVNDAQPMSIITYPLILIALTIFYGIFKGRIKSFISMRMINKLRATYNIEIIDQHASLAYKHIENPDTWDLISRVTKEPAEKAYYMYNDLLSIVNFVISVASVMIVLATQVWWAAILIILFSFPIMRIAMKGGKKQYEANREVSKYQRKAEYLSEVLSNRDAAMERSQYGYGDELNDNWYEQYETARIIEFKVRKKWFIRSKAISSIFALINVFVSLVLLRPVLTEVITPGMFIAMLGTLGGMTLMIGWTLPFLTEALANNKEYLVDLSKFSQLEQSENATLTPCSPPIKFESIEFKNVSFTYPGTEAKILDGMTFKLEKNSHYAFVGANGAGKTTLTKLITGLYNEYEGEILLNGKSIRDYSTDELKSLSAVVYQDFAKYSISFKDNIMLGNINEFDTEAGIQKLKDAYELIGLTKAVDELPQGIDSNLGKIREGGVDVSGGQWQRIAMARAMVSPAPLIILDEPTAALDPISESQIYKEFEMISNNRTTIFISHRLGSTKLADQIIVIGDGKVVEQGTHEELINNDGIYTEMYSSQRSWYQ